MIQGVVRTHHLSKAIIFISACRLFNYKPDAEKITFYFIIICCI